MARLPFHGAILMVVGGALGAAQAPSSAVTPLTEAEEIKIFLSGAAYTLRDGPASAFGALFDPKTPGLAQISKDVAHTLGNATIQSRITVASDTGSESARVLALDWTVRIESHDMASGVTERSVRADAKVERRDGKWIFTSLAPAGMFRPGAGTQAWDALGAASSALRNRNPAGFLSECDHAMPGYDRFAESLVGLANQGQVDSSLELLSLDGSDTERNMSIDWTFSLMDARAPGAGGGEGMQIAQRHETVQVKVALEGKKWRIVSIDPIAFFAPTPIVR